jgi:hypothetical protein
MSNNMWRARLVATWCMSVMTIGALGIVLGAALTVLNGEFLFAACVVPPLILFLAWRRRAPALLAAAGTGTVDDSRTSGLAVSAVWS